MFHLHVRQLSECKHRKAILFVSGSPLLSLFYLSLVISPLYTRTLPSAKPTAICVRFSISARHDTCQSHQQKHSFWQKVPLILTSQRQNLLFLSFSIQTTEWLEMPTVENYKKIWSLSMMFSSEGRSLQCAPMKNFCPCQDCNHTSWPNDILKFLETLCKKTWDTLSNLMRRLAGCW